MLSNHLILCRSLLLLPSILPSIRVFSNESSLHIMQPKYWSFSFSKSRSREYSGLIFFRIDCFDVLAVQGTLKSFLQYSNSIASILQHSNIAKCFYLISVVYVQMFSVLCFLLSCVLETFHNKKWQRDLSVNCSVMSNSLQPHASLHGILQGRILEWVAIPFSRGSS